MTGRKSASQLTPIDLRRLYGEASGTGALDAYRKRRWSRAAEFAGWLEQDTLAVLSPEQALRLYRASGGREAAAFSAIPIEELRDSLDFLLYDTIKLEGRFDECASPDGAYKLAGASGEFVSWLLCLRNPTLFCVWNANAERMLRRAGSFPGAVRQAPVGIRYLDMLESLGRLGAQAGLPDFMAVDEAAWLSGRVARRKSNAAQ